MANRGNAKIGQTIDLGILFTQNGAPFDPLEVRQVEILDSDLSTVIETIPSGSISFISTGHYQVTASSFALPETYGDKWYYTPTSLFGERVNVNTFTVFEILPSGSQTTNLINDIRADIDDEDSTRISDLSIKTMLGKATKHLNRKLNLSGTSDEIIWDGNAFTTVLSNDICSLMLLQTECLIGKRFFSGSIGKGIKVTQGRTSIDTTAGFKGHQLFIGGEGGVCTELANAIKQFKLDSIGGNARVVY